MKVKYLQQHVTPLHVTPLELYELGEGILARLIKINSTYEVYIGHMYHWKTRLRNGSIRLQNPDNTGDWWGHVDEPWCINNELGMLLEVLP